MLVSERIEQASQLCRARLEGVPFLFELRRGRVTREGYIAFLRAVRRIVVAIEDEVVHARSPPIAALVPKGERAAPLLDRDLWALDPEPHRILCDAELRAVAVAADLVVGAGRSPGRLVGFVYVLARVRLALHGLHAPVACALGLVKPDGLAFVGRGGAASTATWHAFQRRLDAAAGSANVDVEAAIGAASELFTALVHILEGLPPYAPPATALHAKDLNPAAGNHPVTSDVRELDAALRAGQRTWDAYPYYAQRYPERGRQFTRSDSAWLATLARSPQAVVDAQIGWLSRVLAARGMPRRLLEVHLFALHDELRRAVPAAAKDYAKLEVAALGLALSRRSIVSDERLMALSRAFDVEVGPELARALPRAGELAVAAAADEHVGIPGAVESLLAWLADPARFPPVWIQAVEGAVAVVRRGRPRKARSRADTAKGSPRAG
jgi:heme oxygenase